MSDFSRTILKWVIVGLVFIICIILLTNLFGREQQYANKNKQNNGGIITNNQNNNNEEFEDEELEDDENMEPIDNDYDDAYYVNTPDTASKDTMSILGIIITTSGIVYLYNKRKIKTN